MRCILPKKEEHPVAKRRRKGYASTTQPPTVLIFTCRSVSSTPLYAGRTDARYSLLLTLYYVNGASTGIGFSICQLFNFPSVGVCCLRPKHRYVYC